MQGVHLQASAAVCPHMSRTPLRDHLKHGHGVQLVGWSSCLGNDSGFEAAGSSAQEQRTDPEEVWSSNTMD